MQSDADARTRVVSKNTNGWKTEALKGVQEKAIASYVCMELYPPGDNQMASIHRSLPLEYQPFEPVETVEPAERRVSARMLRRHEPFTLLLLGLFLAYLRAAFGALVLVQISVGQDEKEPFARRGGDPATGAEELHRVELIVISWWCLRTVHRVTL